MSRDTGREKSGGVDAAAAGQRTPGPRVPGVRTIAVLVLFGLFYAYDLFEAISNLLGVTAQLAEYNAAAREIGLNGVEVPWALLVANIAIVPAAYGVAVLVARKRGLGALALALAVGLAVVAAVTLSLAALA
ncbi:hypothetical protein [Marisediminicola senii]|uniref:hypothetical protein n=1 Tax=Marisediminicola senii TaxID=2711233 RepID=UPI0013EC89AB|nr:hypothetical protein [Marisediminicola senii]